MEEVSGTECPRCRSELVSYRLGGGEGVAVVCESCGFVGVPADHHGEVPSSESWDAALVRFERAAGEDGAPSLDVHRGEDVRVPTIPDEERTTIDMDNLEGRVPVDAAVEALPDDEPVETGVADDEDAGDDADDGEPVDGRESADADPDRGDDEEDAGGADERPDGEREDGDATDGRTDGTEGEPAADAADEEDGDDDGPSASAVADADGDAETDETS